ncbi:MAG: hypothetical protein SGBAC_012300 [Bacillariaceae sp.]
MEFELEDPIVFRSISENQKKLVAVLPIPSAILSLIGSSIIVSMALKSRRNTTKKWTPYNRLVTAMSCFDIVTSLTLALAPFLYPKETSLKAWVIGNDTSCSAIGFFQQLLYAVIMYYGSLSIYFVLTARFGFSNKEIAHRVEPFMHVICFGYPLVTAFAGLFLGAYAEPEVGIGCWVKRLVVFSHRLSPLTDGLLTIVKCPTCRWPKRCVAYREPIGSEERCQSELIGWILGGWVGAGTAALAFLNLIILFVHVRRQEQLANTLNRQATRSSSKDSDEFQRTSMFKTEMLRYEEEEKVTETLTSVRTMEPMSNTTDDVDDVAERARQLRRLKLVQSQALLFFCSFMLTSGVANILRLLESQATSAVEEMELPYKFYGLVVAQCILYPLQGLTNMLVYIRPKYLAIAAENPKETRLWVVRRAIFDSETTGMVPTTQRADSEEMRHCVSEDSTQQPSLGDGTEVPIVPAHCEPTKVISSGASVASVSSMASGSKEMKEVMERTKRRLEKYKEGRLTKDSSSSSLKVKSADDDSVKSPDLMSPIAKARAKLKIENFGIPDLSDDDDEPPLPVPEFSGSPSTKGKGRIESASIRMDGSIVQGGGSESSH